MNYIKFYLTPNGDGKYTPHYEDADDGTTPEGIAAQQAINAAAQQAINAAAAEQEPIIDEVSNASNDNQ